MVHHEKWEGLPNGSAVIPVGRWYFCVPCIFPRFSSDSSVAELPLWSLNKPLVLHIKSWIAAWLSWALQSKRPTWKPKCKHRYSVAHFNNLNIALSLIEAARLVAAVDGLFFKLISKMYLRGWSSTLDYLLIFNMKSSLYKQ